MIIQFVGADHQVTGSAHYVESSGKRFLVDYGMEQGGIQYESKGLPCSEADIDFVLLTHSHVDHSGMLPLLYARGFRGNVYTTKATKELTAIMLRDCAHIQQQEAEWKARKKKRSDAISSDVDPLYSMEDAEGIIKRLVPMEYNQEYEIYEGINVRFSDVGHLLGSASIEVFLTEGGVSRKIVFSGDIGNKNQPLIKDPALTESADYVVMESTYGDRLHEKTKVNSISDFAAVIESTLSKGGNLVIPSFAVGRTQELLYFIKIIKEDKLVADTSFPVYVDSPMAVDATEIFEKNVMECFDEDAIELVKRGGNPLTFPGLNLAITSDESKEINFNETPKVIISASGMCEAGRIRHHLKHNLWRPECTILFVGYQAEGTLGRSILNGVESVKLFGEDISVRARIDKLPGLSGHADKDGLTEWIQGFKETPKQVFVVHGDDMACVAFTEFLNKSLKIPAYAPFSGTVYDLAKGEFLYEADPSPKKKRAGGISDVFNRLLVAGQRLLAVIEKNRGLTNKDLAKFTNQINSLCDKWDPDADSQFEERNTKKEKSKEPERKVRARKEKTKKVKTKKEKKRGRR